MIMIMSLFARNYSKIARRVNVCAVLPVVLSSSVALIKSSQWINQQYWTAENELVWGEIIQLFDRATNKQYLAQIEGANFLL